MGPIWKVRLLPWLALAFALAGTRIFALLGVSLLLGVLVLRRPRESSSRFDRGVAGAAVALSIALPVALLVLILIGHGEYKNRKKQAECPVNLRALLHAERALLEERGHYSSRLKDLSFKPERGNRYVYALAREAKFAGSTTDGQADPDANAIAIDAADGRQESETILRGLPSSLAGNVALGVSGQCPNCNITIVCAAQLDSDAALDVWSVSARERRTSEGADIAPGTPFHELDDGEL